MAAPFSFEDSSTMTKPAAPADLLDLGSLDTKTASDKGAEIELLHPTTNAPLGIFVGILGKHSEAFRTHTQDSTDNRIKKEMFQRQRGKTVPPLSLAQIDANAIELLIVCTTHWFTITRDKDGNEVSRVDTIYFNGEHLPFSVPNAKKIYEQLIWVKEQVDRGIGDLANFINS